MRNPSFYWDIIFLSLRYPIWHWDIYPVIEISIYNIQISILTLRYPSFDWYIHPYIEISILLLRYPSCHWDIHPFIEISILLLRYPSWNWDIHPFIETSILFLRYPCFHWAWSIKKYCLSGSLIPILVFTVYNGYSIFYYTRGGGEGGWNSVIRLPCIICLCHYVFRNFYMCSCPSNNSVNVHKLSLHNLIPFSATLPSIILFLSLQPFPP